MPSDRPFRLRLIHFNDLHGRLADVSPDTVKPVFSRIAGFIRRARAEVAGRNDAGVLVLAGGDDLVGSPFAELAGSRPEGFRCHPAYRLYSAAGVDAGVVGNHELDCGLSMLSRAAIQDASFPLLSANLIPAPWAESAGIQPFAVVPVNGLRVGIIGLTTPAEIKHVVPGEFEIADPAEALLYWLPAVRAQSDVLIVLSHLGHSTLASGAIVHGPGDVELAAGLPQGAAHLIVGSHTHSELNEQGIDIANVVNGIAIVQAGSHGRRLGEVTLDISEGEAHVVGARLWAVEALPEAPEFESIHVTPLVEPVKRLLAEPLGVVLPHQDLDWAHVCETFAAEENPLANFVADALAARCRGAGLPVDFALVDASSVCDGLPRGPRILFGDLFRLAPHADSIVLVSLPVEQLQALLDDNARRVDLFGEPHEERGFVHFSQEVRYRIELASPADSSADLPISRTSRLHAAGATLGGATLDQVAATRAAPLVVACSSFLRQLALKWERRARQLRLALFDLDALPHEVTRLALREELVAYVRQMGGVTEAAGLVRDGRVLCVGANGLWRD